MNACIPSIAILGSSNTYIYALSFNTHAYSLFPSLPGNSLYFPFYHLGLHPSYTYIDSQYLLI